MGHAGSTGVDLVEELAHGEIQFGSDQEVEEVREEKEVKVKQITVGSSRVKLGRL
jgi:hypothetical protein